MNEFNNQKCQNIVSFGRISPTNDLTERQWVVSGSTKSINSVLKSIKVCRNRSIIE